MRVIRGRASTPSADVAVIEDVLADAADQGEPAVRVWRPHRQVAFGRRDVHADGYERARRIARSRGYEPVERSVGGRVVAYAGPTLAFARCQPIDDPRFGLTDRYEAVTDALQAALADLNVDATQGEPKNSFCPGTHSLQADGKLAGIAQRVRQDAAVVSGMVVVSEHEAIATVLDPIYEALDVPFDSRSVGSIANAGGHRDPAVVAEAIEDALVGDRRRSVHRVTDL